MNFIYKIKNFLFPSVCALCGEDLPETEEIRYGICNECKPGITMPGGNKCNICGKPLISEIDTCISCRNRQSLTALPYEKLWVLYPYTGKYRELLTQYKFNKKLPLADFFAEQIRNVLNEPELKDVRIVPVPPRPGKIKEKGWDQVDYLIKRLRKPFSKCLKRSRSQVQKELNREERIQNLKGRIYSLGKVPRKALIIDDVITTGSTMEVCASVLKEAGAEKVYGLCLFYD